MPADVPVGVPALIERIAGAIRDELGAEIDAYPAFRDPDHADPLNRAYRAVVRLLLRADGVPADRLVATTSRTLHQVAIRRLASEGWDDARIEALVESEPGSPDDWLAFLDPVRSLPDRAAARARRRLIVRRHPSQLRSTTIEGFDS